MTTYNHLIDQLHAGINPYQGFDVNEWRRDVPMPQDWNSQAQVLRDTIDRVNPKIIVEVGTFKGASAIWMAQHLKATQRDAAIICIDTWLCEETAWHSDTWRNHFEYRNGRPNIYNVFMANVLDAGAQDYIVPVSITSQAGARLLKFFNIGFDMVFVDAEHFGGAAYRDMVAYWDLLNRDGAMIVDDIDPVAFPGIVNDAERFAANYGVNFELHGRKARAFKL